MHQQHTSVISMDAKSISPKFVLLCSSSILARNKALDSVYDFICTTHEVWLGGLEDTGVASFPCIVDEGSEGGDSNLPQQSSCFASSTQPDTPFMEACKVTVKMQPFANAKKNRLGEGTVVPKMLLYFLLGVTKNTGSCFYFSVLEDHV